MAKRGRSARKKGHNYELKIRQEFIELGFTQCATSRYESKSRDDKKVDLVNTGSFNVQAKAVENMGSSHKVLKEMPKERKKINLVFHKKNRQGEVVSLWKKDFYAIIEALKELYENDVENIKI